jgi:hypothetical protein
VRAGAATRRALAGMVLAGMVLATLGVLAATAGAGAVPGPPTQGPETTFVPSTAPTTAPIITTTLPLSNSDLGRIIPLPNSGAEPEDPGDRGGWQQVGLFVLVCVVILAMGAFVWWRSRVARARRSAEGLDPVTVARERGGDVRKPRPPGIVD